VSMQWYSTVQMITGVPYHNSDEKAVQWKK